MHLLHLLHLQYRAIQRGLLRRLRRHPRLLLTSSMAFSVAAVATAVVGLWRGGVLNAIAVVLVMVAVALSVLGWWLSRPRGLAVGQRRILLNALRRLTPVEVRVSAIDEQEAVRYAGQLWNVMTEARWPVTGVLRCQDRGNGTGVTIAVRNIVAPPEEAIALINALRRVGVPATWKHKPELAGDRTIEVLIGRRG